MGAEGAALEEKDDDEEGSSSSSSPLPRSFLRAAAGVAVFAVAVAVSSGVDHGRKGRRREDVGVVRSRRWGALH